MSSFTINSSATRSMFWRSPSNPSKNCFSLSLPPTASSNQSRACPVIASSNEAPSAISETTSFIVSTCPGVILSITESDTPNEPRPFFIQPSPKSANTGRIAPLRSPAPAALIKVIVCLAVIPPKPIPATLIAVCEATNASNACVPAVRPSAVAAAFAASAACASPIGMVILPNLASPTIANDAQSAACRVCPVNTLNPTSIADILNAMSGRPISIAPI